MSVTFTVLDLETANAHRASACAVGAAKVQNGVIVDTWSTLIRPPAQHGYFDPLCTSLHGIHASDVVGANSWAQAFADAMKFANGDLVVFHNAGFGSSVVRASCAAASVTLPTLRLFCTMVAARRVLSLPSYSLAFVADALGVAHAARYDPEADADAIARVACALVDRGSAVDIDDLSAMLSLRIGRLTPSAYAPAAWNRPNHGLVAPTLNPNPDVDSVLTEKVVVFTGALAAMTRQQAWEAVGEVGGSPERNVTKRTNVLVLGDVDPRVLRPGATVTGRAQKAFELQANGQKIEVMTELDFLRAL